MITTREKTAYLNALKRHTPRRFRRRLAAECEQSLSEFLADHPDSSMDDLTARFGTPAQFADACVLAMSGDERVSALKTANAVKVMVAVGVLAIVAAVVIGVVCIVNENAREAAAMYEYVFTQT